MTTLIQSTQYDIVESCETDFHHECDVERTQSNDKIVGTVNIPNIMNHDVRNVLAMRALYRKFRDREEGATQDMVDDDVAWNVSKRLSTRLSTKYALLVEHQRRGVYVVSSITFNDELTNESDPNVLPTLDRARTIDGSHLSRISIRLVNPRVVMAPVPDPLPYELKWDMWKKWPSQRDAIYAQRRHRIMLDREKQRREEGNPQMQFTFPETDPEDLEPHPPENIGSNIFDRIDAWYKPDEMPDRPRKPYGNPPEATLEEVDDEVSASSASASASASASVSASACMCVRVCVRLHVCVRVYIYMYMYMSTNDMNPY